MNPGKALFFIGLTLAGVGLLIWLGGKWLRFGRLPGDIAIERDGFSLYIPITTMILLSLVATGVLWLAGQLRK